MDIGKGDVENINQLPDNMVKVLLHHTMTKKLKYDERKSFWKKWQGEVKKNLNEMKTITTRQAKVAFINGMFQL